MIKDFLGLALVALIVGMLLISFTLTKDKQNSISTSCKSYNLDSYQFEQVLKYGIKYLPSCDD